MSLDNLLKELKQSYLATLPDKIKALRAAYDTSNSEEQVSIYHQLKGSGASYGLPEVSDLASLMEQIGKRSVADLKQTSPTAIDLLELIVKMTQTESKITLTEIDSYKKLLAYATTK